MSHTVQKSTAQILLSLVVPVHNELGNIEPFLARAIPVLEDITGRFGPGQTFEIIFVDDGSNDGTVQDLHLVRSADPRVRFIVLSRNFGKDTALAAGLAHASGMAVISINVDLRDPPELIPALVERWLAGYDIVGLRHHPRGRDNLAKRGLGAFYRAVGRLADRAIPWESGEFQLISRAVVDVLNRFPERARFMKGLFAWVGFPQCAVDCAHAAARQGRGESRFWRQASFLIDCITSSTTAPLRVSAYCGAAVALIAFAYAVLLILHTLMFGADVPGYAPLAVLILFFGGINLLTLGLIGEYLRHAYTEAKGRPLYIVRSSIGFEKEESEKQVAIEPAASDWRERNRYPLAS